MPNATTAAGEVYSTFWVETGQAPSGEAAVSWPKPVSAARCLAAIRLRLRLRLRLWLRLRPAQH